MKKLNKWIWPTVTGLTIATPVLAVVSCGKTNNEVFDPVSFDNKVFYSKEELLKYINANIDKYNNESGENKVFSITDGADQKSFTTYEDALHYIESKIVTHTVYLNPDILKENFVKISPNNFVETSQTEKYYVFKKWNPVAKDDGVGNKVTEHEYSYVSVNASPAAIEKVKLAAAATYVQVHNGYSFNGIYFANASDLELYLKNVSSSNPAGSNQKFDLDTLQSNLAGNMKRLFLENGTSFDFESTNDLDQDKVFQQVVNNQVKPYYVSANTDGTKNYIPLNDDHISDVSQLINENDLNTFSISTNGGKITQIVDMDRSTPSGSLYGGYFVQSGESVDGIMDHKNWTRTNSDDLSSIHDSNNIQILKSFIDYILMAQGISSPVELMFNVYSESGQHTKQDSFGSYLEQLNANGHGAGYYLNQVKSFMTTIAQGTRYSTLDAIIAVHSFLINLMIQNKEKNSDIVQVSKYFNSMSNVLDTYTSFFLAPFFTKSNGSGSEDIASDFHVNFFESAFHFYVYKNDEGIRNHGIEFQNDPYYYYRMLVGHEGDANGPEHKTIFGMIKAMMGMQSIAMKALNLNQVNFGKWINGDHATNLDVRQDGEDARKNNAIWDFSFKGMAAANDSEEFQAIWYNMNEITSSVTLNNLHYDASTLRSNFNNFLLKDQNARIAKYIGSLKSFSKPLYTLIAGVTYNNQNLETISLLDWNRATSLRGSLYQSIDTFSLIDIDKTAIHSSIASSGDAFKSYDDIQNSLGGSLDQRMANFVGNVGTAAFQIAGAVAAAARAARQNYNSNATTPSMTYVRDQSIMTQTRLSSRYKLDLNTGIYTAIHEEQSTIIKSLTTEISKNNVETHRTFSNEQLQKVHEAFSSISPTAAYAFQAAHKDEFLKIDIEASLRSQYQEALKTNPGLSFDDFKKQVEANTQAAPNGQNSQSASADQDTFNYEALSRVRQDGIASFLGFITGSKTIESVASLAINVASTVIPGLAIANAIVKFLGSFSSSEKIVYTYAQHEQGTAFYWDGGEVDYSWWGLSSSVKHDINDLKMIKPLDIISGYTNSSSGVYWNGKFFSDTVTVRRERAQEIVNTYKSINIGLDNIHNPNVVWGINIKGVTEPIVIASIEDNDTSKLAKFYKDIAAASKSMGKTLYKTDDTTLTINPSEARESIIKKIVETLAPCTIIVLPTKNANGSLIKDERNTLPYPFWTPRDGLREATSDADKLRQANYIVKNPNVHSSAIPGGGADAAQLKSWIDDDAKFLNPSSIEFKNLVEGYLKDLYVQSRIGIFEDIRNPQNITFEDVEKNSWTDHQDTIYSFSKLDSMSQGESQTDEYYLSRRAVMQDALKTKYPINVINKADIGSSYVFKYNHQVYNSINQIYDWIIAQNEGGKHE